MSVASEISVNLPYVRRFARALSGSQSHGDAHVVALLEALLEDDSLLPQGLPSRIGLYRVFAKMWLSTNRAARPIPVSLSQPTPERRIELLTPRSRQAFLLQAVEGFNKTEIAQILDTTPDEAAALIEQAGREIAEQVATSVLVIEDEPVIALDIETMVQELGHDVIGVARTEREAVAEVRRRRPGLVLADIQLADGSSGLDAVNTILKEIEVPVIFVTAYPERLLTGSKPEPAFLITKPFQPDALKAAISQVLFFDQRAHRKVA
jgi:CheY-like chemotaxis protein